MIDREKVVKGMECCIPMTLKDGLADCGNCPYDRKITIDGGITECCHDLMADALSLLKAQEPVKPIIETHWETPSVYDEDVKVTENKCGACGAEIDKWDKFCRMCGMAVKWE